MLFSTFIQHLEDLSKRNNDETNMYNIPRHVAPNVFAFSYDALCTELLRFNEDGTVDEWTEANYDDHEHYEPHFQHASVEEWKVHQQAAIQPID
jgi:hypothetical protein